jgi:hypothetical protein
MTRGLEAGKKPVLALSCSEVYKNNQRDHTRESRKR